MSEISLITKQQQNIKPVQTEKIKILNLGKCRILLSVTEPRLVNNRIYKKKYA